MRTIKRLYIYAVTIISLEIVLWGMIGLVRSMFAGYNIGGNVLRLAGALALIVVGVPVFFIHWWWAQREARDAEERASGVRAVFLHAVLLGTLIPAAQNALAFINRSLVPGLGGSLADVLFGRTQTFLDNLIAVVMNLLIAAYFLFILRNDWKAVGQKEALIDARRVYRYVWVIYGLAMVVGGVQQLLYYLLQIIGKITPEYSLYINLRSTAANGLSLLLVGVPIWVFAWKTVQDSLREPVERESLLRLGVLYFLALAGVTTVLTSSGLVVHVLLRLALGENFTIPKIFAALRGPLSIGIPLGGVWAYYGHILSITMKSVPDAPRRSGMRRLYSYILAAVGLAATFIGLSMLLQFISDALFQSAIWHYALRDQLSAALATLAAGLPLWLLAWRPMQREASILGDTGDHARRSLIRRSFLYLALFVGVIGGMVSAGTLIYNLLQVVFGAPVENPTAMVLDNLCNLILFALLGAYHGTTLRVDGRYASNALAEKHAAFPTLLFDPGDGFAEALLAAIHRQSPRLSVTVQSISQAVPEDVAPKAIVMPSDLALEPPQMLREWLSRYEGRMLVVPRAAPKWFVIGQYADLPANQVAQALRQLAEGQEIRPQRGTSGWVILAYVMAGLFGLEILLMLISLGISTLVD